MLETTFLLVRRTLKYENVRAIGTASRTCPLNQQQQQPIIPTDEPSWEQAKDYSEIPGPKALPVLGNIWRFLPGIGEYSIHDMEGMLYKLNKQYGDFVKLSGLIAMADMLFPFDPKLIERVYKLEGQRPLRIQMDSIIYYRKHYRQDVFKNAKGVGFTQGDAWYRERTILNPVIMKPSVVKHYIPVIEENTNNFVKRLRRIRKDDNKLSGDFVIESKKWALENVGLVGLDTKLGCLTENPKPGALDLFNSTEEIFRLMFELDIVPNLSKYVKTPKFNRMMKALDTQFSTCKVFIDEAIEKIEENKRKGVHAKDRELSILEKLIETDKNVVIVLALDMILAGIDTTSNSLTNLLYQLATNKSKQKILREEINSNPNVKPSDLPYVKACIKEAARMYPVITGGVRVLPDDAVIGGYRVKAGTTIMLPMVYMSHLEKNFPRPDEFIPERWLRTTDHSELSSKHAHPFSILPFGFGPRACIGRRFAELVLDVALVGLVKNFDISYDGPPPKYVLRLVNNLEDVHFVFKDVATS